MATHPHIRTGAGGSDHRPEAAQALQWLATRLGWERTLDALRQGESTEGSVPRAA